MKTLIWTAVILAVVARPLSAFAADGGSSHVFVVNSTGSVTVKTPSGATVQNLAAGYGFNAPYDAVAVPRHDLVVVSNNGNGTLSVFNGRTFAFIQVVNLAGAPLNATNLRGMTVSEDESAVFIAGQQSTNPAVFRLSLPDLTASVAGFIVQAGTAAEDCVVVRSSAVGGTGGSGPGRVYFSVPTGNYLGILNLNPSAPTGSVDLAVPPLANINTPTRLERTTDHSVVFFGCTTSNLTNQQQIGRIQVGASDVFSQPVVRGTIQNLAHQVIDIAWRPDGRGYLLASIDAGTPDIVEIGPSGAQLAVATVAAGVPAADRIRFDSFPPRVYIGENSGTAGNYGVRNATTQPVGAVVLTASGAAGPRSFAFMQNGPEVTGVWPSGLISAPGATVDLVGTKFDPASTVQFFNSLGVPTAPPVTFLSNRRLRVDASGLTPDLYEVRVNNPGLLDFRLGSFLLSITPPPPATPFTMPAPPRAQGYRLRSFPQYLSAGDLLAAARSSFGGYNPSLVRIFFYENSGYVELDDIDPATDLSGRAFWIMTRNGGDLTLARPPVGQSLQNTGQSDKVVILQPEWNLLGMPTVGGATDVRMSMADVFVYTEGSLTGGSTSLDAAATAGTVSFPTRYVNGSYVALTTADDLYAGTGYWIRNNSVGPVYLVFNQTDAVADNRPPGDVWTTYRTGSSGASSAPPPPPGSDLADESGGSSGCGFTGAELLVLLALAGRRRLRA